MMPAYNETNLEGMRAAKFHRDQMLKSGYWAFHSNQILVICATPVLPLIHEMVRQGIENIEILIRW